MFSNGVMNFKRKKQNKKRGHRSYNLLSSFKRSFKMDYILKDEFKKQKRTGVPGLDPVDH